MPIGITKHDTFANILKTKNYRICDEIGVNIKICLPIITCFVASGYHNNHVFN